jgi:molecular chaperone GrpE
MTKKKHESTEVNMDEERRAANEANTAQPVYGENTSPDHAYQAVEAQQPVDPENLLAEVAALEEVEQLKKELEESRAQANEYLDGWQRARAEFANYKKRVDRDQAQTYQTAAGNILKRYLEILDDLDRALKKRPQNGEGASWAAGIELIYRKFVSILEAEGVKAMDVEGKTFDPNMHEAISQAEIPGFESGQIVEEIQKGYMIGERVLRPALVRVAK